MENIINGARSSLDFAQLGELKGRAQRREDSALRETAQQFEAMFLQMLLKTMREAVPRSGFMDSDAVQSYESMYDRELSLHLAQKNSVGIADMLVKSLSRSKNNVQDTESFLLNRSDSPNSYPLKKNHNSPMELKKKREIYNISRPEPSSFPIGNNFENKVNSLSKGKINE